MSSADLAVGAVTSSAILDGTVAAGDLVDGAALAEIVDDDGAGSQLDADKLDTLHGDDLLRSNLTATHSPAAHSRFASGSHLDAVGSITLAARERPTTTCSTSTAATRTLTWSESLGIFSFQRQPERIREALRG
jgi:hypothetical protein